MSLAAWFSDDPSGAIERAFRRIEEAQMKDLPLCNQALTAEAVGVTRWQEHWLGCLITPWTLQLVMLPACVDAEALREGDVREWQFPRGPIVFMASENPDLGVYQACGLLSPVDGLASQEAARQIAVEVMEILFQAPADMPDGVSVTAPQTGRLDIEDAANSATGSTRRDFLHMPPG